MPTRAVEPTHSTERITDTVAQGLASPDAGTSQQVAAPALTAMALSSLHSAAMQFRTQMPQEPEAEPKHQGGGQDQSQAPAEESAEEAASEPGVGMASLRRGAAATPAENPHGRLLRALREASASAAVTDALEALDAGRPLLLAAPMGPPDGLRCEAVAWLLRPMLRGVQPAALRSTGQMLFARVPRGSQCWGWRTRRDHHPTGMQWLPREVSAAALWFGPVAAAAAYSGWREALLSLPAAPRLQQALASHYSLHVLISSTPLPLQQQHRGN
jgi:hypothetical protein